MKKYLIAFIYLISLSTYAFPQRILIMRHGEEPSTESVHLSDIGYKRASLLPQDIEKKFGQPKALYASGLVDNESSRRSIETLTPASQYFNLPLNTYFTKKKTKELAEDILKNQTYDNGLVVIAWSHKYIKDLAMELGYKKAKDWPSKAYNRYWILTYNKKGVPLLKDTPQLILPTDK